MRLLALLACVATSLPAQSTLVQKAAKAIRARIDDPASLLVRETFSPRPGVLCGRISARNHMGGMVSSYFVYDDQQRSAAIIDTDQREDRDALRATCNGRIKLPQDGQDQEDDRVAEIVKSQQRTGARGFVVRGRAERSCNRQRHEAEGARARRDALEDSVRQEARRTDGDYQAAVHAEKQTRQTMLVVQADSAAKNAVDRLRQSLPSLPAHEGWEDCVVRMSPIMNDSVPKLP